jgi:fructose/tagatose bisphosphate aldolase
VLQVIVGDDVLALFKHCQKEGYAIPAVCITDVWCGRAVLMCYF